MSLQIWLPLNKSGDLSNKGLANVTVTNNGATYNASGKIGGCYQFNSTNLKGNWSGINEMTKMSGACWVYLTSTSTPQYFFHLGGQSGYPAKFSLQWDAGAVRSQVNGTEKNTGLTLNANTWYHLAVTVDGSKARWYINGVQSQEMDISGTFTASNNFAIGARTAATDGNSFAYYITGNGKLNDVRIYDHCLSAQEVKEISKGLVLHYTLGSASLASSGNLINGLAGGGQCTVSGNSINISGTTSDTYFYIKTTKAMTSGKLYRLSCIGSGFPESALYNFPIAGQSNTGPGQIKIKNGPCVLTFVANDACANAGTNIIMDDTSRTAGAGTISGFCLEEISSVSDSSGYCRNGIISGTISPADSVRYDKGIYLDGTSAINIGNVATYVPDGNLTVNLWFYKDSYSSKSYDTVFGGPSGFEIETKPHVSNEPDRHICPHNWGTDHTANTEIPYEFNKWNMLTMVRTSSNSKWYLNGELKRTLNPATIPSGDYFIGAWRSATEQNFKGRVSDCRIFATALSADDISDLYKLGAQIS